MKVLERLGKKLGFGIGLVLAGLIGIGVMNPAKGSNVTALILGMYGVFVTGHTVSCARRPARSRACDRSPTGKTARSCS